jgi:hypothetical protein
MASPGDSISRFPLKQAETTSRSSSGAILLYLKGLGLVYAFAFGSLVSQIEGLIGPSGILPAERLLQMAGRLGILRYWWLPTVFWVSASGLALKGVCVLGTALGLALALGYLPLPLTALLWVLYLSVTSVGGVFLGYQWDALLLEAGVLSVVISPLGLRPRAPIATGFFPVLALRFLLFRLVFASGLVKLLSGDPAWRDLTALSFHYETQPLPTWVGWYAAGLPPGFHRLSTAVMFAIEVGVPFLAFGGRKARLFAFVPLVFLQVLIALTGNYGFFNLLTIALCLPLLDDACLPAFLRSPEGVLPPHPSRAREVCAYLLMAFSLVPFLGGLGVRLPEPVAAAHLLLEPFHLASPYGLFAVMTKERDEISVEGSDDGVSWKAYTFRFKPEDPRKAPAFVAPHQPRLDWQMWFAALGTFDSNPWFARFLSRLLEGSPEVLGLLAQNPFEGHPPRYVRAELYRYRFSSPQARAHDGSFWTREDLGPFSPVLEE